MEVIFDKVVCVGIGITNVMSIRTARRLNIMSRLNASWS